MEEVALVPPTLDELRAKRDAILRVAALHRVTNVRVFGSVARGESTVHSDVDLLVDVPRECSGWDFFGALDDLRRDLKALIGRDVDVISIRGPAPDTRDMAADIEREALAL